jgi:uncharacterized membrane protein YeiH
VYVAAATEALKVPYVVDLAAIVVGALTGGLLAAREGFAVSGVLLLAVSGGLGGGLIRDILLAQQAYIVRPGPYFAVAALIGAVALTVLAGPLDLPPLPVAAIVIVLVAGLNVLSVWRGWEAPVAVDLPSRARSRYVARRKR